MRGYSDWLLREGPGHGIRFPTLAERVRSTGRPDYLNGLRLSNYDLFQATGNYFDPDAQVSCAVAAGLCPDHGLPLTGPDEPRGVGWQVRQDGARHLWGVWAD